MATYTPKFKDGSLAYGILGGEIRKVEILKVLVSPNATDPIHVSNTDAEGRVWNDKTLFQTPEDVVSAVLDKYYTKYPVDRTVNKVPPVSTLVEMGPKAESTGAKAESTGAKAEVEAEVEEDPEK